MVDTSTALQQRDAAGIARNVGMTTDGSANFYPVVNLRVDGSTVGVAAPLAVRATDTSATGSITTQNLVAAGVATAGSAVQITSLVGATICSVQVTGVYTGALSAQVTVDGATWVTLNSIMTMSTLTYTAAIVSAGVGIYQFPATGYTGVRITGLAAMTGTAVVTLNCTGGSAVWVNQERLTGNAGATLDGTINTTAPQSVVWVTGAPATASAAACLVSAQAALTVANVKATAGNLYGISVDNPAAAITYIQFYNTAGTPTLGTSVVFWMAVPASGTLFITASDVALANFATGIGIGASTTTNTTGTPASAPNVVVYYR